MTKTNVRKNIKNRQLTVIDTYLKEIFINTAQLAFKRVLIEKKIIGYIKDLKKY